MNRRDFLKGIRGGILGGLFVKILPAPEPTPTEAPKDDYQYPYGFNSGSASIGYWGLYPIKIDKRMPEDTFLIGVSTYRRQDDGTFVKTGDGVTMSDNWHKFANRHFK
jgi:hypothetical protein